jgi:hypothetical protein
MSVSLDLTLTPQPLPASPNLKHDVRNSPIVIFLLLLIILVVLNRRSEFFRDQDSGGLMAYDHVRKLLAAHTLGNKNADFWTQPFGVSNEKSLGSWPVMDARSLPRSTTNKLPAHPGELGSSSSPTVLSTTMPLTRLAT